MLTERCWVGVEEADEYFGYDQAADWAKTMAAGPDVGFAKDVVPQRCFGARRRRSIARAVCSDADLVSSQWFDADVTGLHESPGDRGRAQRAHTASSTGTDDESASDRTCKQRPQTRAG